MNEIWLGQRKVSAGQPPLVIAELGINHEGDVAKARRMIDDAASAGCECVKFQCHIIEDGMIRNSVLHGNTCENIWNIVSRCSLSEADERDLKKYTESKGLIYLSTPFSRAAADRLADMGVCAFKIGSGECNNYPLIKHIATFGKPVILSTGMNDIASIGRAVAILRTAHIPLAIMHCTSIYPTPYHKVRLGAMADLAQSFPDAVIGLSDHSVGNYTCFAAIAQGARIVEKHFTSDKNWPGPDVPISIDPLELADLVTGARAIHQALGGIKNILPEEQSTIDFAYSCVVALRDIQPGERLTAENIWVKRPGTGEIKAVDYEGLLGQVAEHRILKNRQLRWADVKQTAAVAHASIRREGSNV
jgi:sialic acid synthase SpsE